MPTPVPAPHVPRSPDEVTGAWVRRCLGRAESGTNGVSEVEIERVGEGYGLASTLLRVRLGGDAEPASVVVKLWSTELPPGDRETRVLSAFGGRLGPRAPACYHAAVDDEARRAVLVLEDLEDAEQGDCLADLAPGPAARLARALAALHASWWRSDELRAAGWLPPTPWLSLDPDWFAPRRHRLLDRFGDRIGAPARRLLDRVEVLYPRAADRLSAAPPTLLHDDVHLDNVLFDRATAEPVLLDWARASVGPAVLDLADLLVAVAAPEGADEVLSAYREALGGQGVPAGDLDGFEHDVAAAVLVTLVKMTCGTARWTPASPREAEMIDLSIDRAQHGLAEWLRRRPDLLEPSAEG